MKTTITPEQIEILDKLFDIWERESIQTDDMKKENKKPTAPKRCWMIFYLPAKAAASEMKTPIGQPAGF